LNAAEAFHLKSGVSDLILIFYYLSVWETSVFLRADLIILLGILSNNRFDNIKLENRLLFTIGFPLPKRASD